MTDYEKKRKQDRQLSADARVSHIVLNPHFRMSCTRELDCPSQTHHYTGCVGLAAHLQHLKERNA